MTTVELVASTTTKSSERRDALVLASTQTTSSPSIKDYTANVTTPVARSSHRMTYFSNALYMFGGVDSTGTYRSNLWKFDLSTNLWTQLAPSGTAPSARAGHGMFVFNSKVYILAGFTGTTYLQDLIYYDPTGNSWNAVTVSGALPIRAFFAYVLIGSALYVLGGQKGTASGDDYGDVYKLDLSLATPTWTLARNGAFTARCRFAAVGIGTIIYFHGGQSATGTLRTDTRAYDTVAAVNSTPVNTTGSLPGGRISFAMATSGNLIYLYGGTNGTTADNNFHTLNTTTDVWTQNTTTALSYARCAMAFVQNGTTLYIDDGATTLAGTTPYDETWSINLSTPSYTQLPTKQIYVNATSFIYNGITFTAITVGGKAVVRISIPGTLTGTGTVLSLKSLRMIA